MRRPLVVLLWLAACADQPLDQPAAPPVWPIDNLVAKRPPRSEQQTQPSSAPASDLPQGHDAEAAPADAQSTGAAPIAPADGAAPTMTPQTTPQTTPVPTPPAAAPASATPAEAPTPPAQPAATDAPTTPPSP
jgi:hypothetical protein